MRRNALGIAALAALCIASGAGIAAQVTATSITTAASARAGREARILSWVVERYPDATIKDFLSFPAVLLDASESAGVDYRLILAMADKESGMNRRASSRHSASGSLASMKAR